MKIYIQPRPKEPQKISEINDLISRAIKSRESNNNGRLYLKIDSNSQLCLTDTSGSASSMRDIVIQIHHISQKCLQNKGTGLYVRDDIQHLAEQFDTLLSFYQTKKRNYLEKLGFFTKSIFYNPLVKETIKNFSKCLSYGLIYKTKTSYDPETRQKTPLAKSAYPSDYFSYASYLNSVEKDNNREINQFKKLNESTSLTINQLTKAFKREISNRFKNEYDQYVYTDEFFRQARDSLFFINEIFFTSLQIISDKVENGELDPKVAVTAFNAKLIEKLNQEKIESIKLDKEIFKDIVGKHVLGGRNFNLPKGIDLKSPQIIALINDFNKGDWKDGEERLLSYNWLPFETYKILMPILEILTAETEFQNALEAHFSSF